MGTYTEHEWREMAADPAHDKRPPATPRGSFTEWVIDQLAEQDAEDVQMLVDKGWTLDDARAFVGENPREGGNE